MTHLTTYEKNRYALNELMDFVGTDEFMNLPVEERRVILGKLRELVKWTMESEP